MGCQEIAPKVPLTPKGRFAYLDLVNFKGWSHRHGMDRFFSEVDDETLKREKAKARLLRESAWWKRRRGEGRCYYCRAKVKVSELTMDHIVPIIRGGRSTKGNIVPACKACNNKKKYLLPVEWDDYLESIGKREE